MNRISRFVPAMAAALALACFAAVAQSQVMDQVPSDALVVIKINKMSAVNEKAAVLAKQWGLVEMNPALSDPLAYLMTESTMVNGVDKAGDEAIVIANGDLVLTNGSKPPIIILIPVTDYKAFIGNYPDAKKEGELDVVQMTFSGKKDPEQSYVANWGKFAAISPLKDLLGKKPEGFKASGMTGKELDTKDFVAVMNMEVFGPKLEAQLKEHKDSMLSDVEKNLTKDEKTAKYAPLVKVLVTQLIGAGEGFLTETKYASFSIQLSKEGVATSLMADFKPDSSMGKTIAQMKGVGGSLLGGLPEAKYLFFGGGVSAGEAGNQLMSDFLKPIKEELAKSGDDLKPVITAIDGINKMMGAMKGQVAGVIAPTGALGTTSIIQEVVVMQGDAKVLADSQLQVLEAEQKLMGLLPNQGGGMIKFTLTPNAKTVDGVSFSQFTEDIDGNAPNAAQAKQMFAMMYGPNGMTGFNGILDDQHMLTVIGLDDAMISAAIKAAKANTDIFAKNESVLAVGKNLPKERLGEFYFDLGQTVTTITNYAKMMGMPIPVNIKPDLSPIGASLATEGSAVHMDSFIPADLVESMVGMAIQVHMMGAGGRGKPGGL